MNLRPLPQTIADLTPEWLSEALAQAPTWSLGAIDTVVSEPLEAMGKPVHRVTVAKQGSNPQDLLVKLHRQNESQLSRGANAAEAYFYREVASRSGVPVPQTYIAEYDEETGRMLIVQKFLSEGRIGTPRTSLGIEDRKRILDTIAAMHAHWWNSPELDELHGVRTGREVMQNGIDRFKSGELDGKKFLAKFGDRVHPVIAEYYATSSIWGPQLRDGLSDNVTLCHFDVSAKNVFIPDDPTSDPVLFDWELVVKGNVGIEIAQFLFSNTDPDEHGRFPEMVRYYHDRLLAGGVTDYAHETMWQDFRYGCLVRLAAPIALAARGQPGSDELALTLLPLITSAVLATDALELLDRPPA